MPKALLLLTLILTCFNLSYSQKLHWARAESGASDVATDNNGNVIIVSGTYSTRGYFSKYNDAGKKLWADTLRGYNLGMYNYSAVTIAKVATDNAGNIYLSGCFTAKFDFDPSSDSAILLSHDTSYYNTYSGDAFLAKYSPDGKYQWAINIGGRGKRDAGNDVYVDAQGNILWVGMFNDNNVDFDPSPATFALSATGEASPYLAKYTPAGQLINAVCLQGRISFTPNTLLNGGSDVSSVITDGAGNIYLGGYFSGTIDLNPGVDSLVFSSGAGGVITDGFVVKLNSNMQFVKGFSISSGTQGMSCVSALGIDAAENIYLTGWCNSATDFDPGPAVSNNMSSSSAGFSLAKYNQNLDYQFSRVIGSNGGVTYGWDLNVSPDGSCTVVGEFSSVFDADPGPGNFLITSGNGDTEGFILRYSNNGTFQNGFTIGSTGSDAVQSIAVYRNYTFPLRTMYPFNEVVYVGGKFAGYVDFDPTFGQYIMSPGMIGPYFVARYSDLEAYNRITGWIYLDKNRNNVQDANEPLYKQVHLLSYNQKGDTTEVATNLTQNTIITDTGAFTTFIKPYNSYYDVVPAQHTTTFHSYFNTDTFTFAVQPKLGLKVADLQIAIEPIATARPGATQCYHIEYKSVSLDTVMSGTVTFTMDNRVSFLSASQLPDSISGSTYKWNFTNLQPDESRFINVYGKIAIPPAVNIGDLLLHHATIYPIAADSTPLNNKAEIVQRIIASYDPNDKSESHGGSVTPSQVQDDYLQYTIQFQNTGNDTAFNIRVKDTLSARLDWTNMEMVSASHNYSLLLREGKYCEWQFSNINLVDSLHNEPLSHGYITYRIKARPWVIVGDTIKNSASIYFDYNLPVKTNTECTIVESRILPVRLISFTGRNNGKANLLDWQTGTELNTAKFNLERSADGRRFESIGVVRAKGYGFDHYQFTDVAPLQGANYYRLQLIDIDGSFSYSSIIRIKDMNAGFAIKENPVRNELMLTSIAPSLLNTEVVLVNSTGAVVKRATIKSSVQSIAVRDLSAGVYYLKTIQGSEKVVISR